MNFFWRWWGKPRRMADKIHNRKISWLELFTDLAYVFMLHTLITNYAAHADNFNVGMFILFFLMIFYIWFNFALFFDLHGDQNARTTVLNLVQLTLVLLLTSRLPLVFAGDLRQFIWIYIVAQLLLIYLWTLVVHVDPEHMTSSWLYLLCSWFNLAISIGILATTNLRIQVIALISIVFFQNILLLVDSINMTKEMRHRHIPFDESETLEERYGQFTMIVFGESMAIVTEPIMGSQSGVAFSWFAVFLVNIIGLWWIYYAFMDDNRLHTHHQIFIEILHLFNNLLSLVLALAILAMYLFLENPSRVHMSAYLWMMTLVVGIIFGIQRYLSTNLITRIWRGLYLEILLLLIVTVSSYWLAPIVSLWIANILLVYIIFKEEKYQYHNRKINDKA